MGLPADSAALFQAWSGLRVAEDCDSFFAEKPQITLATGPDKASVRGSLPDGPCCSRQPQGPLPPRPVSTGPPLPGVSALLFQAGRPLPTRIFSLALRSSRGLWAQEQNKLIFSFIPMKRMSSHAPLSVEFQTVAPGELGERDWGGLESLPRAPQMTSRVTSFMSHEPTLCQALGWVRGAQEQIRHGPRVQELPGRGRWKTYPTLT